MYGSSLITYRGRMREGGGIPPVGMVGENEVLVRVREKGGGRGKVGKKSGRRSSLRNGPCGGVGRGEGGFPGRGNEGLVRSMRRIY